MKHIYTYINIYISLSLYIYIYFTCCCLFGKQQVGSSQFLFHVGS